MTLCDKCAVYLNCTKSHRDHCMRCLDFVSMDDVQKKLTEAIKKKEKLPDNDNDVVNHPKHYETGKFESIDAMVETQGKEAVQAFCICNAFKYIWRHKFKNGVEDIRKAKWYIDKYLELEDEEDA